MPERNPYAPPTANLTPVRAAAIEGEQSEPPFFATSIIKLSVMSVCTLGLYELYWFYKNWQLIKARERLNVMPFWRAFFAVFFCYQCFSRIREYDHPARALSSLPAGPLAAGWIVFTVMWRLPDPYWLASYVTFVFLIPVQYRANQINNVVAPGHDPNTRFTWLNWAGVAIGCVLLALIAIGFLTDSTAAGGELRSSNEVPSSEARLLRRETPHQSSPHPQLSQSLVTVRILQ